MAGPILRSIALFGYGLLVGFTGLVWVANLFGVADEHHRQIARSLWKRGWYATEREASEQTSEVGRYVAGVGFMLAGIALAVGGVIYLFQGP